MSRGLADIPATRFGPAELSHQPSHYVPPVVALAAWHSLFWLVSANVVGVLIATLLLFPGLNSLNKWTWNQQSARKTQAQRLREYDAVADVFRLLTRRCR